MSDRKHTGRGNGGKGYYIALILCAAAIGISGYLYYQNANEDSLLAQDQTTPVLDVAGTDGEDVAAVATQPEGSGATSPSGETTESKPNKSLKTASPVEGQTVAAYAMDSLSYNATTRDWRVHNGVDIAAEAGTEVCAAADGTVYTTYQDDTMGMTVVIQHEGGYTTKYSSLAADLSVSPGDEVTVGQVIGCVGSTALLETALGDHVHFSVTCDNEPMDPAEFLSLG
ncbi:MAG: M23 family metallopeptidase [Oscillospiraceae bacterium]|nr:M23 family metallopeptidase [Oscillospiraceae bacterium]